tara:strand:+ start:509 stop:880 length:372 start_codon:yes stop_codon:yes gene_type:complete
MSQPEPSSKPQVPQEIARQAKAEQLASVHSQLLLTQSASAVQVSPLSFRQAPLSLQLWEVEPLKAVQAASVLLRTVSQTPVLLLQSLHGSAQVLSQHTPSTQRPFSHSVELVESVVQAVPCAR